MTGRPGVVAVLIVAAALALPAPLPAHEGVRAVLSFDPPRPVVGEACAVSVRFETVTGAPPPVDYRHVKLTADMSGHAMRPVESLLTVSDRPDVFRGRMAFTMAGPWRVVLTAGNAHETLAGTAAVEVLMEAEPAPAGPAAPAAATVDLTAEATEPLFDPWSILMAAIGLTALLEIVAIGWTLSAPAGRRRRDDPALVSEDLRR